MVTTAYSHDQPYISPLTRIYPVSPHLIILYPHLFISHIYCIPVTGLSVLPSRRIHISDSARLVPSTHADQRLLERLS